MEHRIGDVIAFPSDGSLIGKLIKLVQNSDDLYNPSPEDLGLDPDGITHIAFMDSNFTYVEATAYGVRRRHIADLKDRPYYLFKLKPALRKKIIDNRQLFTEYVNRQIGKRYDFLGFLKFIPYFLSFRTVEPPEDNKYTVCSEYFMSAVELVGFPLTNPNTSTATPSDVVVQPFYSEVVYYDR